MSMLAIIMREELKFVVNGKEKMVLKLSVNGHEPMVGEKNYKLIG
jgi:hypothetical protein